MTNSSKPPIYFSSQNKPPNLSSRFVSLCAIHQSMEGIGHSKTLTPPSPIAYLALLSSSLLPFKSSASSAAAVLRRFLLFSLRLLVSLFLLLYSSHWAPQHPSSSVPPAPYSSSPAERALSHVLSVVSRVPVSSRKYELVRSLADRLLDYNFDSSIDINIRALSSAFSQTIRGLEAAVRTPAERGAIEMVVSAVRRWGDLGGEVGAGDGGSGKVEAEKMAAEVVWLAGRMAECGAAEEAVRRWGEANELAGAAITAEPRIQVAFVRVSAFLLKHANAQQFGRRKGEGEEGEDKEYLISCYRMAMLISWLPLLCRASNGVEAPTLSSREKAETVKVLEEMIEKLSWQQQEEVLSLWLHHFTSCPDSDWPNLETCYTRWYSQSRDLLLKRLEL